MGKKYEKANEAVAIRAQLIGQLLDAHGYGMQTADIIAQATQLESYIKNGIVVMSAAPNTMDGGGGAASTGALFPGFAKAISEAIDAHNEAIADTDDGKRAHYEQAWDDIEVPPGCITIKVSLGEGVPDLDEECLNDLDAAINRVLNGGRDDVQMDRDNRQASKRHIRDELDAALSSALAVLMEFQAKSKVGADPDPDEAFTALADILALMAGRIDSPKTQAAEDGAAAALREEVMKRSAKDFEKRMKEETGDGKAEAIGYWSEKERDLRNIHMLGNLAAARIAISELCGWVLSNKDWYAGQKGLEQVDMAIHRIFAIMSSPPHIV
jgi:hypothetical protein